MSPTGTVGEGTTIRRLHPDDAVSYRDLRLEALTTAPEAFSASYEEESAYDLDLFRRRLSVDGASATFGAFAGSVLVGSAGFVASERLKTRHTGTLVGVYVRPDHRGKQAAETLVRAVVWHARDRVEQVMAAVVSTNLAARHLYAKLGFARYGTEPRAVRVNGRYYDHDLLVLDLAAGAAEIAG